MAIHLAQEPGIIWDYPPVVYVSLLSLSAYCECDLGNVAAILQCSSSVFGIAINALLCLSDKLPGVLLGTWSICHANTMGVILDATGPCNILDFTMLCSTGSASWAGSSATMTWSMSSGLILHAGFSQSRMWTWGSPRFWTQLKRAKLEAHQRHYSLETP